jgi:Protein of unknown function (DUF3048) N-terminal domain/Protein of unknown function (DUF3048) C-terminal domain
VTNSRKPWLIAAVGMTIAWAPSSGTASGHSPGPVGAAAVEVAPVKAAPVETAVARVAAGGVLRVSVPEAFGGKTVVGQLTVDRAVGAGYITAFGCDDGMPTDGAGNVARSDLNFDGGVSPVASNRLIVKADNDGDVCFFTLRPTAMIVDVNAVTFDTGVTSFANQRTDTRGGANSGRVAAGGVLRVSVPQAVGGRTVVGQLTVDRAVGAGFVTAFGCDDGLPRDGAGNVARADLNFDGGVSPIASNRLIVKADNDGDVCLFTQRPAALIVDVNGVSDDGVASFTNQRSDTRGGANGGRISSGGVFRVNVPQAVGGKTVVGQLTVDRAAGAGFVTAFGCDDGMPTDAAGSVVRSDLNFDGGVSPVASNRLIVKADNDGDVCFFTQRPAALIVDVNGVSDVGISSFPNQRTDTRIEVPAPGTTGAADPNGVPIWPPYDVLPPVNGVAALTGLPADASVSARPMLTAKIDNFSLARPQWGLEQADAVIEVNVEGVTRFIAMFHSRLPELIGPVRSARTADLDLLSSMNRPVFVYSGANPGVSDWINSASASGVLVDFNPLRSPCYQRTTARPGPHNLLLDPTCAINTAVTAGPARALWTIDPTWAPAGGVLAVNDGTFGVPMDGVFVTWTWDPVSGTYLRSQNGAPHTAVSGVPMAATNVVEVASVHVPSPVDARSPNPITVGTGSAIVHRDGRAIAAVWSRATAYSPYEFFDVVTGAPIPLDAGTTWLEVTRTG